MARSAAIFDLDRTLLVGASGPLLSEAMRAAGVMSRSVPGEKFLYEIFNRIGETLPSMALARQGATLAKGRSRTMVQNAAATVAPRLAELVPSYARREIAEHRASGRLLVMATTTPDDLIRPLAELLGFDDVVATRYGVDASGNYDGRIDGEFVWNTGKLAAVSAWASANDVDLASSYAYSESFLLIPL